MVSDGVRNALVRQGKRLFVWLVGLAAAAVTVWLALF
jgi:hypothetical protein